LCRPQGTPAIDLNVPGTNVPGYRLFRLYGTGFGARAVESHGLRKTSEMWGTRP
jgi:hypothetical protein